MIGELSMSTVLITPELMFDKGPPCEKMLQEAGFEICYPKDPYFSRGLASEQDMIAELRNSVAVIAGGEPYSRNLLSALPELRIIARAGVGFDLVDIQAATELGIAVTVTPTANHEAVAEHALALLFAVAKSIVSGDKAVRTGGWRTDPPMPVRAQTLGIFGLGRIGRSVALRALALRMKVIATEKYPDREFVHKHGIELVDLEILLLRSDFVSLHCPLTDETRGIMNRKTIAHMKPGSVLINTARGGLVVEEDLLASLESGHLRAAALDVFQQEPPDLKNPLFQLGSTVFTPHTAGIDRFSVEDMGIEAAQSIIQLSRGEWPDGAVINDELKLDWKFKDSDRTKNL